MTKDEILARWAEQGGTIDNPDQKVAAIPVEGLVAFVQELLELPPGTIAVQATEIRFGGGASAYPPHVRRAAERLANQMDWAASKN